MSNKLFLDQLKSEASSAAGASVFGALDELILGDRRRQKQLEQQGKLQDLQIKGNKQLMDYGYDQQLQMWQDTNYAAQMEQIKKAGLNPAMIYGSGGGGGGQLGAGVAGTVGSGNASSEAEQKMADNAMMQTSLDRQRQAAEIKLLEAQADNIGKDTEVKVANIQSITADIANKEAQEVGQRLQNDYDKIRNYISEKTANYDIGYVGYMAGQAREQWQILMNNREISDEVKDDIVKNYELMNENILSDMLLKSKQGNLTEAQRQKMSHDILQGWKDLELKESQGDRKLDIEERANDIKARYPTVNQLGGGMLNEMLITLDKLNPVSKGGGWSAR